jgi:hypothetical protein
MDTFYEVKKKSLQEKFLLLKEKVLEVMFKNLFNYEVRYSDEGIFNKIEPYLKTFFENEGYEWESFKNDVIELIKKYRLTNEISEILEKNFKYYIDNLIPIEHKNTINDLYRYVIDISISENRPLTKQYARMIIANNHYIKFKHLESEKDTLYSNIITMIAYEEFKSWIIESDTCVDVIIKRVENRFIKIKVENIDENLLIRSILLSNHFQNLRNEFSFIDYYVMRGKYTQIYQELFKTKISNIFKEKSVFEDIELKNQHSKIPKIKFRETNKSVLKKLDEQNDTYEIVFAAYLKRIGSDIENHKNKTLEYLYEMKEELESIDNIFNHIYDVKILELSKDTDEELDAILSN